MGWSPAATSEVLLQRRAETKVPFGGLWANTCCTHPQPGESVKAAGQRRLVEEMELRLILVTCGSFVYRAVDTFAGLIEHELDHVLVGHGSDDPMPSPAEVDGFRWLHISQLREELVTADGYVPWLPGALERVMQSRAPYSGTLERVGLGRTCHGLAYLRDVYRRLAG